SKGKSLKGKGIRRICKGGWMGVAFMRGFVFTRWMETRVESRGAMVEGMVPLPGRGAAVWPFGAAIFVGACLLFQVQPIIGRCILPWFGGAPGVWTACMLFFQVLLLGGYGYAHFSIQRLSPRVQAGVHLGLLVVCLVLLNVRPEDGWRPRTAGEIAN